MHLYDVTGWHASLSRGEAALRDTTTGEVRIPLTLARLDESAGEVPLVLSRREAERLYAGLGRLLAGQPTAVCAVSGHA